MPEAFITPHVLSWARKRAQFSTDAAAQKVKVRPEQFLAWEEGQKKTDLPTGANPCQGISCAVRVLLSACPTEAGTGHTRPADCGQQNHARFQP